MYHFEDIEVPDDIKSIEFNDNTQTITITEKARTRIKLTIENRDRNDKDIKLKDAIFEVEVKSELTDGRIIEQKTVLTDKTDDKGLTSVYLKGNQGYVRATYTIRFNQRSPGYEGKPVTLDDIIILVDFNPDGTIKNMYLKQGNDYAILSGGGLNINLLVISGIKTVGYTLIIKTKVDGVTTKAGYYPGGILYNVEISGDDEEDNTFVWPKNDLYSNTVGTAASIDRKDIGNVSIKYQASQSIGNSEYRAIDYNLREITFERTYNVTTGKYEFLNKNYDTDLIKDIEWDEDKQEITITEFVKPVFTMNFLCRDINDKDNKLSGIEFTITGVRHITGEPDVEITPITTPETAADDKTQGQTNAYFYEVVPYARYEFSIVESKTKPGYDDPDIGTIKVIVEFDENGRLKYTPSIDKGSDFATITGGGPNSLSMSMTIVHGIKTVGYTLKFLNEIDSIPGVYATGSVPTYKIDILEPDTENNTGVWPKKGDPETVYVGAPYTAERKGKGDITIKYVEYNPGSEFEAVDKTQKTVTFTREYNYDTKKYEFKNYTPGDDFIVDEAKQTITIITKVKSIFRINFLVRDVNDKDTKLAGASFTITGVMEVYGQPDVDLAQVVTLPTTLEEKKEGMTQAVFKDIPANARITFTIKQTGRVTGYDQPPTLSDIRIVATFGENGRLIGTPVMESGNEYAWVSSGGTGSLSTGLTVTNGIKTVGYTIVFLNEIWNIPDVYASGGVSTYFMNIAESEGKETDHYAYHNPTNDDMYVHATQYISREGIGNITIKYYEHTKGSEYEAIDTSQKTVTFTRTYNETTRKYEYSNYTQTDEFKLDPDTHTITIIPKVRSKFVLSFLVRDINDKDTKLAGASFTVDAVLEIPDKPDENLPTQVTPDTTLAEKKEGMTWLTYKDIPANSRITFTISQTGRVTGYDKPAVLEDIEIVASFNERGRLVSAIVMNKGNDYAWVSSGGPGGLSAGITVTNGIKTVGYTIKFLNEVWNIPGVYVSGNVSTYIMRIVENGGSETDHSQYPAPIDNTIYPKATQYISRTGIGDITIAFQEHTKGSEYEAVDTTQKTITFTRTYNENTKKYEYSNYTQTEEFKLDPDTHTITIIQKVRSKYTLGFLVQDINNKDNKLANASFTVNAVVEVQGEDPIQLPERVTPDTTLAEKKEGRTWLTYYDMPANSRVTFTIKQTGRVQGFLEPVDLPDIVVIVIFGENGRVAQTPVIQNGASYSHILDGESRPGSLSTGILVYNGIRRAGYEFQIVNVLEHAPTIAVGGLSYYVDIYSPETEGSNTTFAKPDQYTNTLKSTVDLVRYGKGETTIKFKVVGDSSSHKAKNYTEKTVTFTRTYNANTGKYDLTDFNINNTDNLTYNVDYDKHIITIYDTVQTKFTLSIAPRDPNDKDAQLAGVIFNVVAEETLMDPDSTVGATITGRTIEKQLDPTQINTKNDKVIPAEFKFNDTHPFSQVVYTVTQVTVPSGYVMRENSIRLRVTYDSEGRVLTADIIDEDGRLVQSNKVGYISGKGGYNVSIGYYIGIYFSGYTLKIKNQIKDTSLADTGYWELFGDIDADETEYYTNGKKKDGPTYTIMIDQERLPALLVNKEAPHLVSQANVDEFGGNGEGVITMYYYVHPNTVPAGFRKVHNYETLYNSTFVRKIEFTRTYNLQTDRYEIELTQETQDLFNQMGYTIKVDYNTNTITVYEQYEADFTINITVAGDGPISGAVFEGKITQVRTSKYIQNDVETQNFTATDMNGVGSAVFTTSRVGRTIEYTIRQSSEIPGYIYLDDMVLVVDFDLSGNILSYRITQGKKQMKFDVPVYNPNDPNNTLRRPVSVDSYFVRKRHINLVITCTEKNTTTAYIDIVKRDSVNGNKIYGVTYEFTRQGRPSEIISDNGDDISLPIPNINEGTNIFYIKETEAPGGYQISYEGSIQLALEINNGKLIDAYIYNNGQESDKFLHPETGIKIAELENIDKDESSVRIAIFDERFNYAGVEPFDVSLIKYSFEDASRLEGAKISIKIVGEYSSTSEQITIKPENVYTDKNGIININDLYLSGQIQIFVDELEPPPNMKKDMVEKYITFYRDPETGIISDVHLKNLDMQMFDDAEIPSWTANDLVEIWLGNWPEEGVFSINMRKVDGDERPIQLENNAVFDFEIPNDARKNLSVNKLGELYITNIQKPEVGYGDELTIEYPLIEKRAPSGYKMPESNVVLSIKFDDLGIIDVQVNNDDYAKVLSFTDSIINLEVINYSRSENDILHVRSDTYNISGAEIYDEGSFPTEGSIIDVPAGITAEDFLAEFESNGEMVLYTRNNEEVDPGEPVTAGMYILASKDRQRIKLRIYLLDDDLFLESETYRVTNAEKYTDGETPIYGIISRVNAETKVEDFVRYLTSNGDIAVYTKDGSPVSNDTFVATEMLVVATKGALRITCRVSVIGDIGGGTDDEGDGIIDIIDVSRMKSNYLDITPLSEIFTNPDRLNLYMLSTDINDDGETDIIDVSQLKSHYLDISRLY